MSSLTLLAIQPRLRISEKKFSSRFGGLKNSSYLCGVGDNKPTSLFDILDDTIKEKLPKGVGEIPMTTHEIVECSQHVR